MEGKKVVRTNAAEVTEVLLQSRLKKVGLVIKAELDLRKRRSNRGWLHVY